MAESRAERKARRALIEAAEGSGEKTFTQICELFDQFSKDANLQMEKGNKAAGTRARKVSLELEKLLKQFRKESLEASK